MEINGYLIKDKEEELLQKIGRMKAYIPSINKYFPSESESNLDMVRTKVEQLQKMQEALVNLSYLQMIYNVTVKDEDGITLHQLIKLQRADKSVSDILSSLESQSKQEYFGIYKERKEDTFEYAKFSMDAKECVERAETISSRIRSRRGKIRRLNGTMVTAPECGVDWEEVFSM